MLASKGSAPGQVSWCFELRSNDAARCARTDKGGGANILRRWQRLLRCQRGHWPPGAICAGNRRTLGLKPMSNSTGQCASKTWREPWGRAGLKVLFFGVLPAATAFTTCGRRLARRRCPKVVEDVSVHHITSVPDARFGGREPPSRAAPRKRYPAGRKVRKIKPRNQVPRLLCAGVSQER